jgi:hypothetical protein
MGGRSRRVKSTTISCLLFSAVVATSTAQAQSPPPRRSPVPRQNGKAWTPARTSSGVPDLEGVWNYGTMTPLERPAQWAGKEVLTEAEAEAYERDSIERRRGTNITAGPDWWELQNNVLKNRRTSLVVDPPDGRIPATTDEYQARQRGA